MSTTLDAYNATAARHYQNLLAAQQSLERAKSALRIQLTDTTANRALDDIDCDIDAAIGKVQRAMAIMEEQQ